MEVKTVERKEMVSPTTIQVSGAEAIIRCLLEEGVQTIYGYPGGAIMPVYDELFKFQNQLKHVLVRHEQGAVHAAQGYARVSGEVGVAVATSGPGATNLVTGIADAMLDSTPLVCITGQVGSHLLGSDAFQEIDVVGISTPVTKWNYQITKASEIPEILAKAFFIARSGRPGPVLIDITKDAQFALTDFNYRKCQAIRSYVPKPQVNLQQVERAAETINNAKKPLIVFGQGVLLGRAEALLKEVVEKTGAPVAWTALGLSGLPTSHPQNVGMVGMHGNYAANILTNECDVLIAVGMRFDDRVTGDLEKYAKQAKVIHFEIDPSEIDKNVKADIPVLGDVKETLELLLAFLKKNEHAAWHNRFKELYNVEFDKVIQNDLTPKNGNLRMGEVIAEINHNSKGKAIVVSDVGQHQMVTCRYTEYNQTRSNVTSGGLGTMGFALPAAVGAKMASPDRQVIAVMGDGGFQMNIQELGTIFQYKVPVKMVVLNNNFLGMVRQWQQLFFDKRYASTEMENPDFITIAKGYQLRTRKVTRREDLPGAITEMMLSKEAYFLEVVVEKEENVFPMVPTGASVSDIRLE